MSGDLRREYLLSWAAGCDVFIREFAERAAHWHEHQGDFEGIIRRDPINELVELASFHHARAELLSAENVELRELLYGVPSPSPEAWAALSSPFPGLTRGELDRLLDQLRAQGEHQATQKRRAIASLTHQLIRAGRSGEEIRTAIRAEAERQNLAEESAAAIAGDILTKKIGGARHG